MKPKYALGYMFIALVTVVNSQGNVKYLQAGTIIDCTPQTNKVSGESTLRTYCYEGNSKSVLRIFESLELRLDIGSDDYTQYEGKTPLEVLEHYNEHRSLFSITLFSQKRERLQLSPFETQCIGIATSQHYNISLERARIDFWRVIQLVLGLLLFFNAPQLSHNSLFYYVSGVIVGICTSFMLIIWFTSKIFPTRTMMYGVLISGWTIGMYMMQLLTENARLITIQYREYVFWYIIVTGFISFLICYRFGPPRNRRSKNIIKWVLQMFAAICIYFSSHFEAATVAIVMTALVANYFPIKLWYKVLAFYRRHFPLKRRLISMEEYRLQGIEETNKSLSELREYVNSPKCKQWTVMGKLQEPHRFAAFANGASHLREDEIMQYSSLTTEDGADYMDSEDEGPYAANGTRTYVRQPMDEDSDDDDLIDKDDDDG